MCIRDRVYYALSTEGELEEGLYLSAAALNKVRRDALSTLDRLREAPRPVPFHREEICLDFIPRGKRAATPALIARFSSAGQVTREAMKEADEAFIPLFELAKLPKELFEEFTEKWGVELPRVYFKEEMCIRDSRKAPIHKNSQLSKQPVGNTAKGNVHETTTPVRGGHGGNAGHVGGHIQRTHGITGVQPSL